MQSFLDQELISYR